MRATLRRLALRRLMARCRKWAAFTRAPANTSASPATSPMTAPASAIRTRRRRPYPKPFLNGPPLALPRRYRARARGPGQPWSASISTACVSSSSTTTRTCAASCARCCTASARARSTRRKTARPGLEAFTHYVPDIVITDWAMPIFDGLELTQMIRQPGANANPYVADHHAHRPFREEARDRGARRRHHRIPGQADLGQGRSISASSTWSPIRGPSSRPRPISVPTGGATSTRTMSAPSAARAARPTSSGSSRCSTKPRSPADARQTIDHGHRQRQTAAVATYGDHEVITPDKQAAQGGVRPAAGPAKTIRSRAPRRRWPNCRANSRPGWIDECERLDAARRKVAQQRLHQGNTEALFHAAHDIKGEAATFGFPAVAPAADSLCRLIEHTPGRRRAFRSRWSISTSTRCARSTANTPAPTPRHSPPR